MLRKIKVKTILRTLEWGCWHPHDSWAKNLKSSKRGISGHNDTFRCVLELFPIFKNIRSLAGKVVGLLSGLGPSPMKTVDQELFPLWVFIEWNFEPHTFECTFDTLILTAGIDAGRCSE